MGRVICISPLKQFTLSNGSLETNSNRMLPLIAAIKKTQPPPIYTICPILELLHKFMQPHR